MDVSMKRKIGDISGKLPADVVAPPPSLSSLRITPEDARKILEPLSRDQLVDVLQTVVVRDAAVLDTIRSIADSDTTLRKLFIRSMGCETTTDKLRSVFSSFGELEDAVVVADKGTGKSRGYGFVTYKHIDGAVLALKEPSKKIDGRIVVAQLAAARETGCIDVLKRKIYVWNIPFGMSPERLLNFFSIYGEIEEGPLGFDNQSGKPKGFAFFVYKTEEGAKSSLDNPIKNIDGHHVTCKWATEGRKGKVAVSGDAFPPTRSMPGSVSTGYGMLGGPTLFSGFSGGPLRPHQNTQLSSSMSLAFGDGPGYGNQVPSSFGGGNGTDRGYAGVGYGSGGFGTDQHYGGRYASGAYSGSNNSGSSMTRLPPQDGGYSNVGNYSLSLASQSGPPPVGARGRLGVGFLGRPLFF